jgi:putative methyltransferase (TIGR04325 family)
MAFTTLAKILLCRTVVGPVLRRVPLVEAAYGRYTLKRKDHGGLFIGVFSTYEGAISHIPQSCPVGWDTKAASRIWLNHPDMVQPTAYSAFFWIHKLLEENNTLVDYGGSIGLSYYGYTERADLPKGVTWNVVEVPCLVEAGRRLAEEKKAKGLVFHDDLQNAPPSDLFFSAGTVQYIRDGVPGFLGKLTSLPVHIIINKVPLTGKTPSFWTIQNFGASISPYRIYNRQEFLGYFEGFGYEVVDSWEVPELSCDVPFYPHHSVLSLSGLYLRRRL